MSSPDPAKEILGQTIEEALAKLTHQCRMHPALKIRPEVCSKRKATRQKIVGGKSYPIFALCHDCPGPLPIESDSTQEAPVKPAPARPAGRKKKLAPTVCNVCGRAANKTHWYPSNVHTCAECLYERERQRRLSMRKTWKEAPEPVKPAIEEPPIEVEQKSESVVEEIQSPEPEVFPETYECEIHGLHTGRMFGRQHSKICPKCYFEKASAKMKAVRARERNGAPTENGSGGFVVPEWIVAWADEQGAAKGVPGREIIIGIIGEHIPAEWIKRYFVSNSIGR